MSRRITRSLTICMERSEMPRRRTRSQKNFLNDPPKNITPLPGNSKPKSKQSKKGEVDTKLSKVASKNSFIENGSPLVTTKQSPTTSIVVNEIQEQLASLSLNLPVASDKKSNGKTARRKTVVLKTPTAPTRRSSRIQTRKASDPTPNTSKCITDTTAAENSPPSHVNDTIMSDETNTPSVEKVIETSTHQVNSRKITDELSKHTKGNVIEPLNGNPASIGIIIPAELQKVLIDDAKIIHAKKELYRIPMNLNVAKVIEEYVQTNSNDTYTTDETTFTMKMIFDSIIEYFDTLIGRQLLYDSEQAQYEELCQHFPGETMSKIYPPIYLLRLMVRLNKLMAFSNRDPQALRWIINHVNEFTKYLGANKFVLFE